MSRLGVLSVVGERLDAGDGVGTTVAGRVPGVRGDGEGPNAHSVYTGVGHSYSRPSPPPTRRRFPTDWKLNVEG